MIEGAIGEVVVAKRPEVLSAVIVVALHDMRFLIRNVALRDLAGTFVCRIRVDSVIGHTCRRC